MNADSNNMNVPETPAPDDRLREIINPGPETDNPALAEKSLAGFVLLKLNGYHKPPLAEELVEPEGGQTGGCTCNSVCTCVPVQTCACDAVCTCDAVSQGSHCGCVGDTCHGGGWAPCGC